MIRTRLLALASAGLLLGLALLLGAAHSPPERDPNSRSGGEVEDTTVTDDDAAEQGDTATEAEPADELPADAEENAGESDSKDPDSTLPPADPNAPPAMPTKEQISAGKQGEIENFIPVDYQFRLGIICDFVEEVEAYAGETQSQTFSPLLIIDPRTGGYKVAKKDFPARVIASSRDGKWLVAIVKSADVEGTSGAANKEAAISLFLPSGDVKVIKEFASHSNFQALFAPDSDDRVYYCVNEPGSENQIVNYNLASSTEEIIPAEGNRFTLYGLSQQKPKGIWVRDPLSLEDYPVVSLLDVKGGKELDRVEFPGTQDVYAQPGGHALLASVMERSEASIGYYNTVDKSFHQVPDLVLSRPEFRWLKNSNAIVAKESTTTADRFISIDLDTSAVTELYSVKYKVRFWDVSPQDDALVLVADTKTDPVLTVVPIGPHAQGRPLNSISLKNISNLVWVGCLNAYSTERWYEKIFPKGFLF